MYYEMQDLRHSDVLIGSFLEDLKNKEIFFNKESVLSEKKMLNIYGELKDENK